MSGTDTLKSGLDIAGRTLRIAAASALRLAVAGARGAGRELAGLFSGPFTGRKFALSVGLAFTTIVGANTALVVAATGSFPGLVVKNSYVASQDFEARREAFAETGLTLAPAWSDGRLVLGVSDVEGRPVEDLHVTATVGRPTFAEDDRLVVLRPTAEGYASAIRLEPGRWQAAFAISPAGASADTPPVKMTHRFTIEP